MAFLPSLPEDARLLHVFGQYPELAKPLIEFHQVLLRGPSPLSEGEREMIAAYVSGLNACRYCHGIHTMTAENFGIEEGLLETLVDDVDGADIDDRLRPLLRFARKLTVDPSKMVQADADAVFAAGWDERALHHVIMTAALFNFMNRMVEGHGLQGDPGYALEAGQRLHDKGYGGLLRMLGLGPEEAAA